MSLTKCLNRHKVSDMDQGAIRQLAEQLKSEGYEAPAAAREAVILHMQNLLDDRAEALSLLGEQVKNLNAPAHPVESMFTQPAANDAQAVAPTAQTENETPVAQPAPALAPMRQAPPESDPAHDVMALNAVFRNWMGDGYADYFEAAPLPQSFSELAGAIQEIFSVRIAPIRARSGKEPQFNGARLAGNPGVLYLDVDGQPWVGLLSTVGHEFLHDLRAKRPDIYNWLVDQVKDYTKDLDKFKADRENREGRESSPDKLQEELMGDLLGDAWQDPEFLQSLADENPTRFKQFANLAIRYLNNIISKLKSWGRKPGNNSDQYVTNLSAVRDALRTALNAYAEGMPMPGASAAPAVQQDGEIQLAAKRKDLGDFQYTEKNGALTVYGDTDAIREQLPEGIKGRVTKEGLVFSQASGARVKNLLGGNKKGFSRGGEVLKKKPMRDGKYVGAPEKYNTPGKIGSLRRWLSKLVDEGEAGRFWYENSSQEILRVVRGDVTEAKKLAALLSIYSPQMAVAGNTTSAIRAWGQYQAGQPIKAKDRVKDTKAAEAMKDPDAYWSGEKTGNFVTNLLRRIDPSLPQGATIDMWMMRAAMYDTDAPTTTQYAFMEDEVNRIAKARGWEPQQVQAAIWVAMKARTENKGVVKRAETVSIKKGWMEYVYPKGTKKRKILNKQAHRDNWLKHAFAHNPTEEDTQIAKFDFQDGLLRHIGQVSFEARPGRTSGVLPGIHTAAYEQQLEYQQAIDAVFYDEDGTDILALELGLLTDQYTYAPGVWQGEISPSNQQSMVMSPALGGKLVRDKSNWTKITEAEAAAIDKNWKKNDRFELVPSVDPAQEKLLNVYAAIKGLVARQEGVGWHRPFYNANKSQNNGIELRVGRPFTPQEAAALEQALSPVVSNMDDLGMISSPEGMRVVNFGAFEDNAEFRKVVEKAADVISDSIEAIHFYSDGFLVQNNWTKEPNGASYIQQIRDSGRPNLLGWVRDVLAPRVQAVNEDFSQRYGWGDPGAITFSARQRDGRGEQGSAAQRSYRDGVSRDGLPVRADGQVPLTHWGRVEGLTQLDPNHYGTAAAGRERGRQGPEFINRTYYGMPGYDSLRDAGVRTTGRQPAYFATVDANDIISFGDAHDMFKEQIKATHKYGGGITATEVEQAIKDAGYKGYYVLDGSSSGYVVAMFEPLDVKPVTSKAVPDVPVWDETGATSDPGIQLSAKQLPPTINIDGVQRPTTNSEGKPIGRNEQEVRNFWKWFGESKVVDAEGRPLVVYHGTRADFTEFSREFAGSAMGGEAREGFFFTPDRNEANDYVDGSAPNGQVMPVFLSIKKPVEISYEEHGIDDIIEADTQVAEYLRRSQNLVSRLRGKDGLIVRDIADEKGRDLYVAFNPNQIKSAVGNNGQFSQTDDRISFSRPQQTGNPEYGAAFEQMTDSNKSAWDKTKEIFRKQFGPGGLLPTVAFDRKVTRDGSINAEEFQITHNVGLFDHAVKKAYGKKFEDLSVQDKADLDAALRGQPPANLNPDVAAAAAQMRHHTDAMSMRYYQILWRKTQDLAQQAILPGRGDNQALADAVAAKVDLLNTIMGNMGTYLNRSYQVFDDPKWHEKIPRDVFDRAMDYLVGRYVDSGMERADALTKAKRTVEEIIKNNTAYSDFAGFIHESTLGAKDLSILKHRNNDIAPQILALMGEYTDPRINYARTVTKQSRLVFNELFLQQVKSDGMGTFFWDKNDPERPQAASQPIAAKGSKTMEPLNGLYTTPEVAEAFKTALDAEQLQGIYKYWVRMNGLVKFGKTVLAPTTAMRNFLSASLFTTANGHMDWRHMNKSWQGLVEVFRNSSSQQRLDYLKDLKRQGVIHDNPYAGEMMKLLEDAAINEVLFSGEIKSKQALRKVLNMAQKFYQFGDDFWKIIGYENEKSLLMKAGMSEVDAKKEAAKRIRDTYPTYSMIGKTMQALRRFPLVGTFVSFPSEIIRTQINMIRYIAHDMKDPALRPIAVRRATGMLLTNAAVMSAGALSAAALGMDDDEEEAVKRMAAPWSRNSNFLYMGYDQKGNMRYLDLTFLDPYNYFKRPINALLRDEPWERMAIEGVGELLKPFLGADITTNTIGEVVWNKKTGGGPVYQEHGAIDGQVKDIGTHLIKGLQPGLFGNATRIFQAYDGKVTPSGKRLSMEDELWALAGFRFSTMEPATALRYRSYEFKDQIGQAHATLYRVLRDPNTVKPEKVKEAYQTTLRLRDKAFKDMHKLVVSSRAAGVPGAKIVQMLSLARIAKRDIPFILRGQTPPWRPSPTNMKNTVKQAGIVHGPEAARMMQQRYGLLR